MAHLPFPHDNHCKRDEKLQKHYPVSLKCANFYIVYASTAFTWTYKSLHQPFYNI